MPQKIRKYLAYIGPYPYSPYLIFLLFMAIMLSRLMPIAFEVPAGPERHAATATLAILSLIPSIFFAGMAWFYSRFRFWSEKSLVLYIAEVGLASSFIFFYFPRVRVFVMENYGYDLKTPATASPAMFVSCVFMFLCALALIHTAERKILKRLKEADDLAVQLRVDREELVNLDEAIRRQTSRILHDRVQSDLMVVGMKLKTIQGATSAEAGKIIDQAITRLEETRSTDLRNLIQVLSPNFEAGGLKGSIESLVKRYESGMSFLIEVDESGEQLDSLFKLGTYRIIEQGLLNAFVHGPAKNVFVSVVTNPSGQTDIVVSDDGPGTDFDFIDSGVGTAVIDSWVGILNGKKTVDTVPGHGYRLMVSVPRS
jgi:signal transduction histidine kinase